MAAGVGSGAGWGAGVNGLGVNCWFVVAAADGAGPAAVTGREGAAVAGGDA